MLHEIYAKAPKETHKTSHFGHHKLRFRKWVLAHENQALSELKDQENEREDDL